MASKTGDFFEDTKERAIERKRQIAQEKHSLIAALEKEENDLDAFLEYIESRVSESNLASHGDLKDKSAIDASVAVMDAAGDWMHYADIHKAALTRGWNGTLGAISAALSIDHRKENARIEKHPTKAGVFRKKISKLKKLNELLDKTE